MPLHITDFNGVDLVAQPPKATAITAAPVVGGRASIQCAIFEDPDLPNDYVTGTLDWNDGSQPVVYNGTAHGQVVINTVRSLPPGNYVVTVVAHNYATPAWETLSVNFAFQVTLAGAPLPTVPIVYGPILPKDTGFPNAQQWNWDRGEDLAILASSVKMLLTTAKGERIMQPEYGTNLRLILFEFNTTGIEGLVQQEIVDALGKWEQRVSLQFLAIERTGEREVTVSANFISKLNAVDFSIPMVFAA